MGMLARQALNKVNLAPYDNNLPFQSAILLIIFVHYRLDVLPLWFLVVQRYSQIFKGKRAQPTTEFFCIVVTFLFLKVDSGQITLIIVDLHPR
jgi:hypothetical protein